MAHTGTSARREFLAGCRDEEQNRPLSTSKSTYHGPSDDKLSEQQLREIRHRMNIQAGGQI